MAFIVVTGAAGFIGSCVAQALRRSGEPFLALVDDFHTAERKGKSANLERMTLQRRSQRLGFFEKEAFRLEIKAVVHLGARTDTTETDVALFNELNLDYSKAVWRFCSVQRVPLIYASSAATYGGGEHGYDDRLPASLLNPLNAYGRSKNDFDHWVSQQTDTPPHWYGLKFFNVFGPNEYHKGRMASVVFHAFHQIQRDRHLRLFKSHRADYEHGQQMRDFVYVKDVVAVVQRLLAELPTSGIYNLGTGTARTFTHLGEAVFNAMGLTAAIEYIDMPMNLRDQYQYFTEASTNRLLGALPEFQFTPLESAVSDYVRSYLLSGKGY